MSDEWGRACSLVLLALGTPAVVGAEDDSTHDNEMLDTEFLEYLGSWSGNDEDWLVIRDVVDLDPVVAAPHRSDSEVEQDDEG